MNKYFFNLFTIFFSLLMLCPLHSVQADDDYIEANRLLDSGDILPLENILKKILKQYPGKILELDLEKEHGQIVYEIEILQKSGVVRKLYINARNGKLITIKGHD